MRLCRAQVEPEASPSAAGQSSPGPAASADLDAELQRQIDEILKEIDPEGLVVSAGLSHMRRAAGSIVRATARAALAQRRRCAVALCRCLVPA